jgi:hypothetical protein
MFGERADWGDGTAERPRAGFVPLSLAGRSALRWGLVGSECVNGVCQSQGSGSRSRFIDGSVRVQRRAASALPARGSDAFAGGADARLHTIADLFFVGSTGDGTQVGGGALHGTQGSARARAILAGAAGGGLRRLKLSHESLLFVGQIHPHGRLSRGRTGGGRR